jgi:hypothetical protein
MKHAAIVVIIAMLAPLGGCYNTYQVPKMEFRKLQARNAAGTDRWLNKELKSEEMQKLMNRSGDDPVAVKTTKQQLVAVTRSTKTFVRSSGGRRYQITPFNFSMNSSQLVASDRDTLLPIAELQSYEVDLLSNGKTIGIISVGVAAAAGFIAVIVLTAGEASQQAR